MDIFVRMMIEMSQWVRRRPSKEHGYVLAVVIVLTAIIGAVEWLGYWPDFMKMDRFTLTVPSRLTLP